MQQGSPFGAGPFGPFGRRPGSPRTPRATAGDRPRRRRHGNDQLNIALLLLALVLAFVSFATSWVVLYAAVALVGAAGVRAFSKDDVARCRENERFLSALGRRRPKGGGSPARDSRGKGSPVAGGAAGVDDDEDGRGGAAGTTGDAAAHPAPVVLVCPSCGQRLSVPSGKGKLRVSCPKCGTVSEHTT